jgi:hypothetical protein
MFWQRAAFAESTKSCYRSHLNSYLRFCIYYSRIPVPADQIALKTYAAYLARSLKPSSLPGYFNIIRILHLERGLENPIQGNWDLNLVMRGISRQLGSPPAQKLPITIEILKKIHRIINFSDPCDLAFWAACLTGLFGLLRKSSLLPKSVQSDFSMSLIRSDVVIMERDCFVLQIRKSKTNHQRVLKLPFVACKDEVVCPVYAMLTHLTGSKLGPTLPLFAYLDKGSVYHLTHNKICE